VKLSERLFKVLTLKVSKIKAPVLVELQEWIEQKQKSSMNTVAILMESSKNCFGSQNSNLSCFDAMGIFWYLMPPTKFTSLSPSL
jgi:hypothetical protein